MGRYFGTDGIRGRAGDTLTPELVLRAADAFARCLPRSHKSGAPRAIVLGQDPRTSSPMLAAAAASGAMLAGCDVLNLGIVPTPLVPFALLKHGALGGVMVTASHNPIGDNGVKFFGKDGQKATARDEGRIEAALDTPHAVVKPGSVSFGQRFDIDAAEEYLRFLSRRLRLKGNGHTLKVVLDCAHGATCALAPQAFEAAGFDVSLIHCDFDGSRINVRSGATDLRDLAAAVRKKRADLGLGFDGDGDRVLAVDHTGQTVSGDKIVALLATRVDAYRQQGAVVMTHMTNLGVEQALGARGIRLLRTEVGDIKVLAAMRRHKLSLGGEQSGHILMLDLATTGDGILTGLRLAAMVRKAGRPLAELAAEFPEYPQQLTNLAVSDKDAWRHDAGLARRLGEIRASYPGVRFYLRPSGTENLVRVLTESQDVELCAQGNAAACAALRQWDER